MDSFIVDLFSDTTHWEFSISIILIYQILMPSIATPTHWEFSMTSIFGIWGLLKLNVLVSLKRSTIKEPQALHWFAYIIGNDKCDFSGFCWFFWKIVFSWSFMNLDFKQTSAYLGIMNKNGSLKVDHFQIIRWLKKWILFMTNWPNILLKTKNFLSFKEFFSDNCLIQLR